MKPSQITPKIREYIDQIIEDFQWEPITMKSPFGQFFNDINTAYPLTGKQLMRIIEIYITKKTYENRSNSNEDLEMLGFMAKVVFDSKDPHYPEVPNDWKDYLLDIKLFKENLISRMSDIILFFVVHFFKRDELIEKLKSEQISYSRKMYIAAVIDWYPEELNVLDDPYNYLIYMYNCSKKNVRFEFKEDVIYSIPISPLFAKILGMILGHAIVVNNQEVLKSLKHVFEYFLNTSEFGRTFFLMMDIMKQNEKNISKEGLEYFEKSGLIENLMEVNFHQQLKQTQPFLYNEEMNGLYHFFPEKMKSLIMKNIQFIDWNNPTIDSIHAVGLNMLCVMINNMKQTPNDELYFMVQQVIDLLMNNMARNNKNFVSSFVECSTVLWDLVKNNKEYECLFAPLIVSVTKSILNSEILPEFVSNDLLCVYDIYSTKDFDFHEDIVASIMEKLKNESYDFKGIVPFLDQYSECPRYCKHLTKYIFNQIIENGKIKDLPDEKMNRFMFLLALSIDYASIKRHFNEYMIILKNDFQKDKLVNYSNTIYYSMFSELMEAKYLQKLEGYDEIITETIQVLIINRMKQINAVLKKDIVSEEEKKQIQDINANLPLGNRMIQLLKKFNINLLKEMTDLLIEMGHYLFEKHPDDINSLRYLSNILSLWFQPKQYVLNWFEISFFMGEDHFNRHNESNLCFVEDYLDQEIPEFMLPLIEILCKLDQLFRRPYKKPLSTIQQRRAYSLPLKYYLGEQFSGDSIISLIQRSDLIDFVELGTLLKDERYSTAPGDKDEDDVQIAEQLIGHCIPKSPFIHFNRPFKVFNDILQSFELSYNGLFFFREFIVKYVESHEDEITIDDDMLLFIDNVFQMMKGTHPIICSTFGQMISFLINVPTKRSTEETISIERKQFMKDNDYIFSGYKWSNDVFESYNLDFIKPIIENEQLNELLKKYVTPELVYQLIMSLFIAKPNTIIVLKYNLFTLICTLPFQTVKEIIDSIDVQIKADTIGRVLILTGLAYEFKRYQGDERNECIQYIKDHLMKATSMIFMDIVLSLIDLVESDNQITDMMIEKCIEEDKKGNTSIIIPMVILFKAMGDHTNLEDYLRILLSEKYCLRYGQLYQILLKQFIKNPIISQRILPVLREIFEKNKQNENEQRIQSVLVTLLNLTNDMNKETMKLWFEIIEHVGLTSFPADNIEEVELPNPSYSIHNEFAQEVEQLFIRTTKQIQRYLISIIQELPMKNIESKLDWVKMSEVEDQSNKIQCINYIDILIAANGNVEYGKRIIENQEKNGIPNEMLYVSALKGIISTIKLYINDDVLMAIKKLIQFKSKLFVVNQMIKTTFKQLKQNFREVLMFEKEKFTEDELDVLMTSNVPFYIA